MELYQHNKEAYDKIQTMFQREDRVAIIHATGTGKSYIALQWLSDNRDKKCLFLAPTYEILDQLERHMQSQGLSLKNFPNLKCIIYDNLASLPTQALNNLRVDNIVLDEFHRCGAPTWGKAVNAVLQNNLTAKVLGITATPVRYLDNQRDMAQEIFNGNIASEISLSDAIADGILPMPKYISAVYSFDEDLKRIQNKIEKVQNPRDKDILQKDLEAAKRTLEKSEGLPEIFAKHLPVRNGKYIVFCKDFAHMQRMMQEACGWLKDINPNLDIYSVYSEQSRETNQRNVADFERFQNDHIKLLFSIEMLNEGVHVNDVDGVIMLRPTNSPIIYLQQLGRALSVGHKEHPIIFDIVNNINSNKIIYDVYQEVKEKLSGQQRNRNNRTINLADFKILDELKEPSDFIEALDDLLDRETISGSNFEARFEQLIKFIQDHNGHLPSKYSKDDDEKSLNMFYYNNKDKFSEQQKQRLINAGFQRTKLFVAKKKSFDERFDELIKFIQDHNGQLPRRYSEGDDEKSLAIFYKKHKAKFSEQQKQRLINAGVQRKKSFDERFDELIEFIQDHNGHLPRQLSEDDNEKSLAIFYKFHKAKFSEQQKQRLINAGVQRKKLFVAKKKSFDERFDELIEFIQDHNGHLPSKYSEDDNEKSLNMFYYNNKDKFSEQQKQRLINAGVLAEKLEKKTKCTIDPADGKRVLKQRQKDDLQNGGLTQ